MMVFGLIGILFKKLEIPAAPVLLGSILGPMVELNFSRTLRFAEFDDQHFLVYLVQRPISAVLPALLALLVFANARRMIQSRKSESKHET